MEENLEPFNDDRQIPIPSSINSDVWGKGDPIGSGAYGNVYVGRHRTTKTLCAIKEMRDLEDRYVQSLHQEIKLLRRLKHHNIVKYYDSKIVESKISIYMEYVEHGSLKKYIRSRRALQETLVQNFTKQILLGLVYLHGQKVVHRDIKPDNLLVDSKNNVKLADFGLAKHLAQSAANHSVEGTICYAAPELIQRGPYKNPGEAYVVDIWSLGCVVIEMFTGMHPWPNCTNPYQVIFKVCFNNEDPAIPENLSLAGKDFLERCFTRDPAKRPSAAKLLNHPFVNANPIPSAIGLGKYEMVYAGRCSRVMNFETKKELAIMKIWNAFDNRIDAKRTLREIKLLCHMDHDNIIKIKDIIRPPERQKFNDVYIAYELMDTDLFQIIRSSQDLTDEHCQVFLYQLLIGLKYIHSANVLHCDLKPSNLLLNVNCDLKICNFGLAGTTSETDFMTEYVTTHWYRAPELLLDCSEYTAAIDIWSVGCILMEIIRRKPLFPGKDYVQQLTLITRLLGSPDDSDLGFLRSNNAKKYVQLLPHVEKQPFVSKFPDVSPLAIDLVEKMLVFDPSKRITVEEALNHPFLSSLHGINEEPICPTPFIFDFEQTTLSEEDIKDLIWSESLNFHPDEMVK